MKVLIDTNEYLIVYPNSTIKEDFLNNIGECFDTTKDLVKVYNDNGYYLLKQKYIKELTPEQFPEYFLWRVIRVIMKLIFNNIPSSDKEIGEFTVVDNGNKFNSDVVSKVFKKFNLEIEYKEKMDNYLQLEKDIREINKRKKELLLELREDFYTYTREQFPEYFLWKKNTKNTKNIKNTLV